MESLGFRKGWGGEQKWELRHDKVKMFVGLFVLSLDENRITAKIVDKFRCFEDFCG